MNHLAFSADDLDDIARHRDRWLGLRPRRARDRPRLVYLHLHRGSERHRGRVLRAHQGVHGRRQGARARAARGRRTRPRRAATSAGSSTSPPTTAASAERRANRGESSATRSGAVIAIRCGGVERAQLDRASSLRANRSTTARGKLPLPAWSRARVGTRSFAVVGPRVEAPARLVDGGLDRAGALELDLAVGPIAEAVREVELERARVPVGEGALRAPALAQRRRARRTRGCACARCRAARCGPRPSGRRSGSRAGGGTITGSSRASRAKRSRLARGRVHHAGAAEAVADAERDASPRRELAHERRRDARQVERELLPRRTGSGGAGLSESPWPRESKPITWKRARSRSATSTPSMSAQKPFAWANSASGPLAAPVDQRELDAALGKLDRRRRRISRSGITARQSRRSGPRLTRAASFQNRARARTRAQGGKP